ncbi:hypothetical protein AB0L06_11100 [Spirillospora sp. NPDC052269]
MEGYTPEEWELVASGPALAMLGAIKADPTPISMAREFVETGKVLISGASDFPQSVLIKEICSYLADKDTEVHEKANGTLSEEFFLGELAKAIPVVRAKSGEQEAQNYIDFTRHAAKRITEASGEKLFGTGEKVSDKEQAFLERLEKVLVD